MVAARTVDPVDQSLIMAEMLANRSARSGARGAEPPEPSDEFLVQSLRGGDAAALKQLMDRYDRLVRYSVYKLTKDQCQKDPQWLDSIASATWAGFVQSVTREGGESLRSVSAFLIFVARNQAISALRRKRHDAVFLDADPKTGQPEIAVELKDPSLLVSEIEELAALRDCLGNLDTEDRPLTSQLAAITERRWKAAAEALGMSESTLRSRWGRILDQLRDCVERRTGIRLAPGEAESDY